MSSRETHSLNLSNGCLLLVPDGMEQDIPVTKPLRIFHVPGTYAGTDKNQIRSRLDEQAVTGNACERWREHLCAPGVHRTAAEMMNFHIYQALGFLDFRLYLIKRLLS